VYDRQIIISNFY